MVECYFRALRMRNKLLLGQLVVHVIERAMSRMPPPEHLPISH